jgi:hypothetical protein
MKYRRLLKSIAVKILQIIKDDYKMLISNHNIFYKNGRGFVTIFHYDILKPLDIQSCNMGFFVLLGRVSM